MNKHTPGPWVVDDPNFELVARLNEGVYSYVADCDTSIISLDTETVKANANLIAAAPELLEALESVCRNCLKQCQDCPAPSAIKKAHGETP